MGIKQSGIIGILIILEREEYKLCPFSQFINGIISSLLCCKKGTTLKNYDVNYKNSRSYWKVTFMGFTIPTEPKISDTGLWNEVLNCFILNPPLIINLTHGRCLSEYYLMSESGLV